MPAPRKLPRTAEFNAVCEQTYAANDTNDCAVKAVTFATGRPYAEVHAVFEHLGRKTRKGTPGWMTDKALAYFGFKAVMISMSSMIARYPSPHRSNCTVVTTHHPDRFPKAWRDGKTYLIHVRGHILAVVNGVTQDWTRSKALRARYVEQVVRIVE